MTSIDGLLRLAAVLLPLSAAAEVPPERQEALIHLLRHDCGSCHGMTLKGGLGPALTAEALADKPPALLVDSILHGRSGTAMPPWEGLLSREEVTWLVDLLREGM